MTKGKGVKCPSCKMDMISDIHASDFAVKNKIDWSSVGPELLEAAKELVDGDGWATGRTLDRLRAAISRASGDKNG